MKTVKRPPSRLEHLALLQQPLHHKDLSWRTRQQRNRHQRRTPQHHPTRRKRRKSLLLLRPQSKLTRSPRQSVKRHHLQPKLHPPPPAPYSEPEPEPEPESNAEYSPSSGLGICYSPYNSDGTCKDAPAVSSDLSTIAKAGYSIVRIYGVDCNQISNVLSAASTSNLQVFAGLLTITDVAGDLGSLIKQAKGDLSRITTISIGNELVDMGKASVGDVIGAVGTARGVLGAAGFKGSIVTVDTFNALIAHPELCQASDYCAANAHSYFDGTIEPSGAGAWVQKQVGRIGDAAGGGKRVVITESGWPHAGGGNGVAVPSPENQAKAVESIRGAFGDGLFLFSAFDDKWKQDGAWGVEKNWGIMR